MSGIQQELRLSQIKESPAALRTVNTTTLKFKELVSSIQTEGVLQPIRVRPIMNEETNEQEVGEDGLQLYWLVDGLHRYTASLNAGLETVPCIICNADDMKALVEQIMANVHRENTKPVEFSRGIQRMMSMDNTMTLSSLCAKLSKSEQWVREQLGLLKLDENIQAMVDESKINLTAAYALAKLPVEEQRNFLDRAITMDTTEFVGQVHQRKKDIAKARSEGRAAGAEEFTVVPKLQSMADIKGELANLGIGVEVINTISGLETMSPREAAQEAFKAALSWVLTIDKISYANRKAKHDEEQRKRAERREAAGAPNKARRIEEAKLRSQRLLVEADAIEKGLNAKEVLAAWDTEHHFVKGRYCPPETAPASAPAAQ